MDHREHVSQLAGQIRDDFQGQGRIRNYWEFLGELRQHPYRLLHEWKEQSLGNVPAGRQAQEAMKVLPGLR